jgi:hypothetical protein
MPAYPSIPPDATSLSRDHLDVGWIGERGDGKFDSSVSDRLENVNQKSRTTLHIYLIPRRALHLMMDLDIKDKSCGSAFNRCCWLWDFPLACIISDSFIAQGIKYDFQT